MDFNKRKSTKLEDRSYLMFEFYGSKGEITRRFLPFFQNPEVDESKKVNLVKYQPMGRSSTLFTYTGAESRSFNVGFKITLPAVLEFQASQRMSTLLTRNLSKEEQKALFFHDIKNQKPTTYWATKGNATDFDNNFLDLKSDEVTDNRTLDSITNPGNEGNTDRQKVIDIIMYWVNMIRSSALNNSIDPTYGPPLIRLNHGILYQDIPCVCSDYKIGMDDAAGYDLKTMLPRTIQISMNLMEYRSGNFSKYDVTKVIERDNIVGWESIIGGSNTIDPIRTDIGRKWRN